MRFIFFKKIIFRTDYITIVFKGFRNIEFIKCMWWFFKNKFIFFYCCLVILMSTSCNFWSRNKIFILIFFNLFVIYIYISCACYWVLNFLLPAYVFFLQCRVYINVNVPIYGHIFSVHIFFLFFFFSLLHSIRICLYLFHIIVLYMLF